MTLDDRVLIELDGRRRASLARLGRPEHRRYLARVESDGTIVLTPAAVVPLAMTDEEIEALPDEAPNLARAAERRREQPTDRQPLYGCCSGTAVTGHSEFCARMSR